MAQASAAQIRFKRFRRFSRFSNSRCRTNGWRRFATFRRLPHQASRTVALCGLPGEGSALRVPGQRRGSDAGAAANAVLLVFSCGADAAAGGAGPAGPRLERAAGVAAARGNAEEAHAPAPARADRRPPRARHLKLCEPIRASRTISDVTRLIFSIRAHSSSLTGMTDSRDIRTRGKLANARSALTSASVTGRASFFTGATSTTNAFFVASFGSG